MLRRARLVVVPVLVGLVTLISLGAPVAAQNQVPGSLTVRKILKGDALGKQGKIVIHSVCDGKPLSPDLTVPAGFPRATRISRTYRKLPAGSHCTVTETSWGQNSVVVVDIVGDGQEVTVPAGGDVDADVTDTYTDAVGSLIVRKTITGPAAGHQGEVVIHSVCNGVALIPDFVVPAGSGANDYTHQYDDIPTPATCTVTETSDGSSATVDVSSTGSGQTVTIASGEIAEADVSDIYGLAPGQLEVSKTVAGTQAGSEGVVTIHTVCNGTVVTPDFTVAANSVAGVYSHTYSPVPAGAVCTSTETVDGATSAVSVVVRGSPATTTMPPGDTGGTDIVDIYGPADGALLVTKNIEGSQAGHQGPVTIHAICNGTALTPDFVIPAGAPAGSVAHSYDNIPAGSVCAVTETADGATSTISVTVAGDDQQVAVPAGEVAVVGLVDVYEPEPGSLQVTKTITGTAAGQQGAIAIQVSCGGTDDFTFGIPAHTGAGSVSRSFDGLPAGANCTITETATGATAAVAVVVTGSGQTMTIAPTQTTTATLTNKYDPIALPAAGPATNTPETLPVTGPRPNSVNLFELGTAAIAAGGLLVAAGSRRRYRRRRANRPPARE